MKIPANSIRDKSLSGPSERDDSTGSFDAFGWTAELFSVIPLYDLISSNTTNRAAVGQMFAAVSQAFPKYYTNLCARLSYDTNVKIEYTDSIINVVGCVAILTTSRM